MSAARYNIFIEQGAYWERTATIYDANEEVRDLDGYTAEMQIRRLKDDAEPLITLSSEAGDILIDGPSGGIMIVIPTAKTTTLPALNGAWYDLELIDEFGERERLFQGKVTIDREVTR